MFRRSFITNLLALINIPLVTKMSRGRQSYEPIELSEEDAAAIEQDRLTGAARPKIPLKPLRPYEPIGTSKWLMQQQICLGIEQTPDEMDHNVGRSKAIKDRYGIPGIVEYVYYDPKNLKIFRISEEEYKIRLSMPLAKFDSDGKFLNVNEILTGESKGKCWINEEDAIVDWCGVFWGVCNVIKNSSNTWFIAQYNGTINKIRGFRSGWIT